MKSFDAPIRLNLGCGLQAPPGWVNVDGSWNARLAKFPALRKLFAAMRLVARDKAEIPWSANIYIHDVRKPLPFADQSASVVFASHVLEHLYRDQAERLLREAFSVLCPGGIVRIVVPDLETIVQEYNGQQPFGALSPQDLAKPAADRLNERLLMRSSTSPRRTLYWLYDSWNDFHSHKWMYDLTSLTHLMRSAGFVGLEKKSSGESAIENIAQVEDPSRISNGAGICVEGRKP